LLEVLLHFAEHVVGFSDGVEDVGKRMVGGVRREGERAGGRTGESEGERAGERVGERVGRGDGEGGGERGEDGGLEVSGGWGWRWRAEEGEGGGRDDDGWGRVVDGPAALRGWRWGGE
jgi:hypothetical protein